MEDIANMIDAAAPAPAKRGPYKKHSPESQPAEISN
jgi:hypothetical protein